MASPWEQFASGLGAVLTGLGSVVGIRTEEQPRYELLVEDREYEIRAYAPYLVATVVTPGSRREGSNASFRILAGYIFGKNQKQERMSMTAPVVMKPESEAIEMTAPVLMTPEEQGWSMSFVLPARYTRETLPLPVDPRIVIRDMPEETLAVVRFTGTPEQDEVLAREKKLRLWLEERQVAAFEAEAGYRFAGYDPPFTLPLLRRNEVMIPVKRRHGLGGP
jgi:hypothetical protein